MIADTFSWESRRVSSSSHTQLKCSSQALGLTIPRCFRMGFTSLWASRSIITSRELSRRVVLMTSSHFWAISVVWQMLSYWLGNSSYHPTRASGYRVCSSRACLLSSNWTLIKKLVTMEKASSSMAVMMRNRRSMLANGLIVWESVAIDPTIWSSLSSSLVAPSTQESIHKISWPTWRGALQRCRIS